MRLADYLSSRRESQSAFAIRATLLSNYEVSQRTVSRICEGSGCNSGTALAIIVASHAEPAPGGGTVALQDLVAEDSAA